MLSIGTVMLFALSVAFAAVPGGKTVLGDCSSAQAVFTVSQTAPSVLKNVATGLCVDANAASVNHAIALTDCSSASTWQWADQVLSTTQQHPCRVSKHGKDCNFCLDLYDGPSSGVVDAFDCVSGNDNQRWTIKASGDAVSLRPVLEPSKCLVASSVSPGPGPAGNNTIVIDPTAQGREYYGVGGLSNSDAPWLRDYPEPQRSDILDALFLPHHIASLQILKVEIGGDGRSTIVTESSHMHTPNASEAGFQRGWEWWLLKEALKRNPLIRTAALAWTAPYWVGEAYYTNATIDYLVAFLQGAQREHNVTFDFLGMRNESPPPEATWIVQLRRALDAAGFGRTVIFGDDSHSFEIVPIIDANPEAFAALGIIGVHEPLRNAESVPADATATGKPIWASEAYTTVSDSNGAGCWARVSNWGPVFGNVSAQIAWNLIQSYPGALGYSGHGLMWAEQPWSGNYVVNPPLWASAHYTQFTRSGWRYLRNGRGSGMLEGGGSYITVVDPASPGAFATIVQAMAFNNSKCFKDTHPPFDVADSQSVRLDVGSLKPAGGHLQLWRSCFAPGDDPAHPTQSSLFEQQPEPKASPDGFVDLTVEVNCVYTLASTDPESQAAAHGKATGPIPAPTAFPRTWCHSLQVEPQGGRAPYMLDRDGVFEGDATGTLTQVVPQTPVLWHDDGGPLPVSFVGPNVTAPLSISCQVRPAPSSAYAGVGASMGLFYNSAPPASSLLVYSNGTACVTPKDGVLQCASEAASPLEGGWYNVSLSLDASLRMHATVNGRTVAGGVTLASAGQWTGLLSSWDASSFQNLCITQGS